MVVPISLYLAELSSIDFTELARICAARVRVGERQRESSLGIAKGCGNRSSGTQMGEDGNRSGFERRKVEPYGFALSEV